MKVRSDSFADGERIPALNAMGKHNPESNAEFSDNKNPHLAWDGVPEGTKSLVVVCVDTEVPTKPDDVNKEGTTVPYDLPRTDFYHWVLVDVAADAGSIAEGAYSDGVTNGGKSGPESANGTRSGLNNYTQWFDGDETMGGKYYGYDGPFPPWNDERLHKYAFTVYATDLDRCPVEGDFTGPEVLEAIEGHVLGSATITGIYAIYPDAR